MGGKCDSAASFRLFFLLEADLWEEKEPKRPEVSCLQNISHVHLTDYSILHYAKVCNISKGKDKDSFSGLLFSSLSEKY